MRICCPALQRENLQNHQFVDLWVLNVNFCHGSHTHQVALAELCGTQMPLPRRGGVGKSRVLLDFLLSGLVWKSESLRLPLNRDQSSVNRIASQWKASFPTSPALPYAVPFHICPRHCNEILHPHLSWSVPTGVFLNLGRWFSFFSRILSLFMSL